MFKKAVVGILFALLSLSACAEASDLLFDLSGTYSDGSTLSGTLSFDGFSFDAVDWRVSGATNLEFTQITQVTDHPDTLDQEYDLKSQDGSALLFLDFAPITFIPYAPDEPDIDPRLTLLGYTGGPLCSEEHSNGCIDGLGTIEFEATDSGILLVEGIATIATPEPASAVFPILGLAFLLTQTLLRKPGVGRNTSKM